jgi:hypothetical protein
MARQISVWWGGGFVKVQVGLDGDSDPAAVSSLYRWLVRDPEMKQHAEVSLASGGAAGDMGALDVINIALTQAISLLSLAVAYAAWRDSRSKAPPITITIEGGASATLGRDSEENARLKLAALLEMPSSGRHVTNTRDASPDVAEAAASSEPDASS